MDKKTAPKTKTGKHSTSATAPTPSEAPPIVSTAETEFPIVGIGASAGGLAAFEAFFPGCQPMWSRAWPLCWCSTWHRTTRAFWST